MMAMSFFTSYIFSFLLLFAAETFGQVEAPSGVGATLGELQGTLRRGCQIEVRKTGKEDTTPLYIQENFFNPMKWRMVMPRLVNNKRILALLPFESFVLACPGEYNFLKAVRSSWHKVRCVLGSWYSHGVPSCKYSPKPWILPIPNDPDCTAIGYWVTEKDFIEGYRVCSDNQKNKYTRHEIFGHLIIEEELNVTQKDIGIQTRSQCFGEQGPSPILLPLVAVDDIGIEQNRRLASHLEGRAHQWETIYNGNWLKVENEIRKIAKKEKSHLDIYTGVYGPSTIRCNGGREIQIMKYLWKIVHDSKKKSCIGFIVVNNPGTEEETLCPNTCTKYGWNFDFPTSKKATNPENPYTYKEGLLSCCSYGEIKEKIQVVPRDLECNSYMSWRNY